MESLQFFIQTFGCQMNDHDSSVLARLLEEEGHREVPDASEADVILVNTCAIREKAEQKVYSQLGRYKQLKGCRPGLVLGVGGCMAQSEGRRVLRRAPYVDLVFGTHTLAEVPVLLERIRGNRRRLVATETSDDPAKLEAFYRHSRPRGPRAYVTVMQGCDNYCAYCVVPYVRGREVSRPAGDVTEEVERLAAQGVREVTLLGQNVNSYGQNPRGDADFPELVRRLARVKELLRIRFTTSHPKDLSEGLVRLFEEEPKLMPHIHLPLQSGSNRILAAMNRRYTVDQYFGLVDRLRRAVPGMAITSDMIVGFPGEEDGDFRATLDAMERVVFDGLFSFKFSPRPGTAAVRLEGQVPDSVKEDRLRRLQELQKEHSLSRNRELVGTVRPMLVEEEGEGEGGRLLGRTPENKIVSVPGGFGKIGEEIAVRITVAAQYALTGELEAPGAS